jgi:phosphoribosylaminoimidazole carboxylase
MFLLKDDTLLINEIAPRPHNSGHYTIEACPLSQYDVHLRAILDLPIPESSLIIREPAIMLNILGGSKPDSHLEVAQAALSNPRTSVHLYGKGAGSKGRKMGHVTVTAKTMAEAETLIQPLIDAVDSVKGIAPSTKATSAATPLVAVIMGSDSDMNVLQAGIAILEKLAIPYTSRVTSAHRTPEHMAVYTSTAAARGVEVIIAAAGGAAHLPGMAAAYTALPVIGVPVRSRTALDGMDSLLSEVQMPAGVPVATVGINNSANAALLAARILGVKYRWVQEKVEAYAAESKSTVLEKDRKLEEMGFQAYFEKFMK